ENKTGYLIFIEDARAAVEQAQALKLAALGRLTAGIAHQVRNPLAAIAHANQLLAETPALDERARELVRIIARQSTRLDGVVEDILSLSRPGTARPRALSLALCLDGFVGDYRERQPGRAHRLQMRMQVPDAEVNFDMGHLDHIVGNLVDNAFVHGDSAEGVEMLLDVQHGQACLEVLDRGPGPGDTSRFFEPFFTTHASGTGLGLYIARELANANGARLTVSARDGGGTRFRLEFARDNAWLQ
ncbi:MAG: sensor histidine kinase, partial [Gammaproteobacteria bacterium]